MGGRIRDGTSGEMEKGGANICGVGVGDCFLGRLGT